MANNKPAKIGRFEVIERIGEGFHGKLYLCWDPTLKRKVALKIITQAQGDSVIAQKIVDEALMVAQITHPNVIPIYEASIENNTPVMVFEFVQGVTLKEYLEHHGAFSEKEALSIMVRIASGLAVAHEQSIVHLDLSPNNFMIDQETRPRIMDFGLARLASKSKEESLENKVSGTPRYMSPEHLNGEDFSPASDIYTLGLVFFELLTGQKAIERNSLIEVFLAVETADINWRAIQYFGISPHVIAILRNMIDVEPSRRYQSAADLVIDLDKVIQSLNQDVNDSLSLEFLLRRLERNPEFPICSQKITEINKLTDDSSNTDFNKIADLIIKDYSLTKRVMTVANSVAFNPQGGNIATVSHAISKLGLKLVRMICTNIIIQNQTKSLNDDLKDELIISFVSALIAKELAEMSNKRIAEEAFICALFHRLGIHLLAFYLTDEYLDIRDYIHQGMDINEAERKVLATSTNALGQFIAAQWNFPDNIVNSMKRLPLGELEAPSSEADFLLHISNYANELCCMIHLSSDNEQLIAQLDQFVQRHHSFIKQDIFNIIETLNNITEEIKVISPDLGVSYQGSQFCTKLEQLVKEVIRNQDEMLEIA